MNETQKRTTDKYREGWDRIQWHKRVPEYKAGVVVGPTIELVKDGAVVEENFEQFARDTDDDLYEAYYDFRGRWAW